MPDPVKTLWYIKYYILNSNGRLEHSSYSISSNCQKICSRTGSEGKISENEFSNATYGLNTVLTTKQSKNDLLKKRWLEIHSLSSEAVVRSCTVKNVFLKISQNSQDNTWHRCFPVNFAKFLRRPFFTERLLWLLLLFQRSFNSFWLFHIFCLVHHFFYHLFTRSHAQRNVTSNLYFSLYTLSFCYMMYYIVLEKCIGRRFLNHGCFYKQIISAESLIPDYLTQ